ncbi:hypothetical protein GNP80_08950 [Aliivibrio fischeri]|uniref:hypothetical protein n=1 Tax=Aliivibrio fischeri TaxID=668 RepID=UPI0012D89E49|nr:hypothetical protein [Aliivibrio fischeri]MUK92569.1 hypothetical protein [Aliivibrio fischeri]
MEYFNIRSNAFNKISMLLNNAAKIVLHKYTDETGSIRRYLSVSDVVSVLKAKKCAVSAKAENKALDGIQSLSIEFGSRSITAYFGDTEYPSELNPNEKDLSSLHSLDSLVEDFDVLFSDEEKALIIASFKEAGLNNEVEFLEKQPVKSNVISFDFKQKIILG